MNKSKLLSKKASDLLNQILDHPFIIELSLGVLPQYKFDFYSTQDKLYLREYSKGLRKLGVLTKYKQFFDESANGIENEQKMLTETQKTHLQSSVMTPSNLLYTSYLMRFIAEGDIPKSIAAFYSCFWVYYKVGIELNKSLKKDNPYYSWIELYASLDFKKATKEMKLIFLESLESLNSEQITETIEVFKNTCRMEYLFWDSAYKLEKWPDQSWIFPINYKPPCVLTIAGSDSGGGAGIQADLNTFSNLEVFGTVAITALTAQNSKKVAAIEKVNGDFIKKQIECLVEDFNLKVAKIGMLNDKETLEIVGDILKEINLKFVIDPVMVSTSGCMLLKEDCVNLLSKRILPMAEIITPNIPEAERLLDYTDKKIDNEENMIKAAKEIAIKFKIKSVLIKGGHLFDSEEAIDILYLLETDKTTVFKSKFLDSKNTHGTGCSLSSAIAAYLSKGYPIELAVKQSKKYVYNAIKNGFQVGQSDIGTLNHLKI